MAKEAAHYAREFRNAKPAIAEKNADLGTLMAEVAELSAQSSCTSGDGIEWIGQGLTALSLASPKLQRDDMPANWHHVGPALRKLSA